MKCPKCGYEITIDSNEHIKKFNEAVAKEVENRLKAVLDNQSLNQKVAVQEAISEKEKEINNLSSQLKISKANLDAYWKEELAKQVQSKNDEIENLKRQLDLANDYKLKMNVKDLGEDLEQYCLNKFNAVRANTYPYASFDKDSDVSINGEKGDFIFRDYIVSEDGSKTEYVSIMFDMKNEDQDGKTKHKNSEYFKKLDSDRNAKHCEYAVLVSMRELGNEQYDQGIADVSYAYPKMYVVRPQHFLTIIGLIRNAALNNAKAKKEIAIYKQQNFDVVNFENEWNNWKREWGNNLEHAKKHYEGSLKAIEASIKSLEKTRDGLMGMLKQLDHADTKVEQLTLKKLAKNSPSIKKQLKK